MHHLPKFPAHSICFRTEGIKTGVICADMVDFYRPVIGNKVKSNQ